MRLTNRILKIRPSSILSVVVISLLTACNPNPKESDNSLDYLEAKKIEIIQGEEDAILTSPPEVPPAIKRKHATKMIVNMEIIEEVKTLSNGVDYTYWTFGGTVPGSFIRVREGDLVEFHLLNHPDNRLPHNIDLHAVTGPGGGATSSFTAPGHESIFSFTAINPGIYVYHCATAPVGMHIANGMYGLILVEPKEGLPEVDKEYYIMQGEFYTKGAYGDAGLQPFNMEKALAENPDYVVFNGSVGALLGDNAITAELGDRVRLFVGNGGPNLVSSFHVIGEIFDNVYVEGGTMVNHNVQSTLIPAGGATVTEFRVEVPGTFIMVDHSIFRAFNKGALANLKVDGGENTIVYSGKEDDRIYLPEGSVIQEMPVGEDDGEEKIAALSKGESIQRGKMIYSQVCQACHQSSGAGIPGAFPPLAQSDYLNEDTDRAIETIIKGLQGEIAVNGVKYNGIMPRQNLSDLEVANVLTYVYNSWENNGTVITPDMVKGNR